MITSLLLLKLKGREVNQNAIQLRASSQHDKKKRTYNEASRENVLYVIVSAWVDWIIIKVGCFEHKYHVLRLRIAREELVINRPETKCDSIFLVDLLKILCTKKFKGP